MEYENSVKLVASQSYFDAGDIAGWGIILLGALLVGCIVRFIIMSIYEAYQKKEDAKYNAIISKYKTSSVETCEMLSEDVSIEEIPTGTTVVKPTYNTMITAKEIGERIDEICRWEKNGDIYRYVVASIFIDTHALDFKYFHWNNEKRRLVRSNESVAKIEISPLSESSIVADIPIEAPVDGLLKLNKQNEYRVRDVVAEIDTSATAIKYFNEAMQEEECNLEHRKSQPLFYWHRDGDNVYLIASESVKLNYSNCQLEIELNNKYIENTTVRNGEIMGVLRLVDDHTFKDKHSEQVFFNNTYHVKRWITCVMGSSFHTSHAPKAIAGYELLDASIANPAEYFAAIKQENQDKLAASRREQEDAEKQEIALKIKEKHRRRQLERLVELELIEAGEIFKEARRPTIPQDVKNFVYNRDGGRCIECGSTENLHFDHILPFSKGGATNVENLQILCQKCNLEKSNKI